MTTVGVSMARDETTLAESAHGRELFRYTYRPDLPERECPAPYFHPLRTLAGDAVTAHRPNDHRWHKGLAMTASHLSGHNFWGGGTYTPGAPGVGYVDLPNVGSLRHNMFDGSGLAELVYWITPEGEKWIEERRRIEVRDVDLANRSWCLDFATELHNVRGSDLEFGSPTVFGRELAGYCGFFWRGPRAFTDGTVLAADGRSGPEMMGQSSPWLAYVGEHDVVDRWSTLLFLDHPDNPVPDGRWFVRTTPFPAVNPSLAFFDPLTLPPGEALALRYRLVVADGAWDRDRLETYLWEHPW